jgi:hypothetical protein
MKDFGKAVSPLSLDAGDRRTVQLLKISEGP